ncbi:murein hydrolase activator EnvC family protein [Arthrobacter sp. H41]|uniref:murein hydrolase activator EnvC family protein n=1 Tax=Arthrobacter sp. H41 TaxID=1312978 RepID=UPI0004B3AAEF|nr:M23 family metallopeptidase [Arthrobacter sp. H41]
MLRVAVLVTALAFGGTAQPAILGVDEAGALPVPSVALSATPFTTSGSGSFAAPWSWPLAPEPSVLRHFQPPPERWNAGHRGVDLSAAQSAGAGTAAPVHSPADGVVSFAGTVVNRPVLSIDHGDGLVSSFEPVATTLRKGDRVAAGDAVGTIEGPAHCPVLCVHWGVRLHGEYVDPLDYVSDRRPSVLLPLRR